MFITLFLAGISIDWVQPPPVQVQAGSRFNVSYMISVDSNEFFDSMRAFPTSIYNMRYNIIHIHSLICTVSGIA